MKWFRFLIIYLLVFGILIGCARKDTPTINKAVWSSRDPFNIPYNQRFSELVEGNKVVNPSFERGRSFRDNIYGLTGWKEVGKEIEWVNIAKTKYDSIEARTGNHAIKINRKHVSEVEEDGVGIMSDYIKVFPGNYSLTYSIRLKNICSNKERLGSRLMDAVNVRVFYYDKNKIRIDGNTWMPGKEKKFDNEFKALPFAGFWNIDSLGWIRARGISHKFPFSDGDIPDNTRYIRLFFGLKGTGTLWIDDVNLEFSRQNFTLMERVQSWKDSVFELADLLVPEVKHLKNKVKLSYYESREIADKKPLIFIPENADEITLNAAHLLRKKLLEHTDGKFSVPIVHSMDWNDKDHWSLIFSLGNNTLNRKYRGHLPFNEINNKKQGYFIHRLNDSSNIIAVSGNAPIGNYYGITTLIQLFDHASATYNHADITDYPDFTQRGICFSPDSTAHAPMIDFLTSMRFNRIYSSIQNTMNRKIKQDVQKLGKNSLNGNLYQAGVSVNPYRLTQVQQPEYLPGDTSMKMLQSLIHYCRNHSLNNILLRMDDTFDLRENCTCFFEPGYEGVSAEYRNLIDVHSQLINEVNEWTDGQISLLPPWHYNNCIIRSHGKGEIYLEEMSRKVPRKTEFLWTGPVNPSFIIDQSEIKYIEKRYRKKPVFLSTDINPHTKRDFISNYPGKARQTSIFNHFNLDLPGTFPGNTDGRFIAELTPDSGITNIKIKSLANYLWNSKNFQPAVGLLKILISEFGKKTAFDLIEFNEAYLGLYEMYGKIKTKETKRKYIRSADGFKIRIDQIMQTLRENLEDEPILFDLEDYKQKADLYYERIQKR